MGSGADGQLGPAIACWRIHLGMMIRGAAAGRLTY